MTKKIFYTLFFFAFLFWNSPIFAHNSSVPLASRSLDALVCDAPAPDSFRVTGIASDLVSLEWTPVWNGATHSLIVFRQDSTGEWANSGNYSFVQGEAYSIYGLKAGSYKVLIATICPSGETSFKTAEVLFKIIELTTAGRIPIAPVATDCAQIDYQNHLWVGFRVKEIETGKSNLFDVQIDALSAQIMRVSNNSIVAVNSDGLFPVGIEKYVVNSSFRMDDKSKPENLQIIGYVLLKQDFSGPTPTIKLCVDANAPVPWKSEYKFTALTAENVSSTAPPGGTSSGLVRPTITNIYSAQTPFTNSLMVFTSENSLESRLITIQLFDPTGRLVQSENIDMLSTPYSLNTTSIPSGVYFLKIGTSHDYQTIKVIKAQ